MPTAVSREEIHSGPKQAEPLKAQAYQEVSPIAIMACVLQPFRRKEKSTYLAFSR